MPLAFAKSKLRATSRGNPTYFKRIEMSRQNISYLPSLVKGKTGAHGNNLRAGGFDPSAPGSRQAHGLRAAAAGVGYGNCCAARALLCGREGHAYVAVRSGRDCAPAGVGLSKVGGVGPGTRYRLERECDV